MLQRIQEFKKNCEIAGFKDVEVKDVDVFLKAFNREKLVDVEIQFFDADVVATWQHLYFAALNALMVFKNHDNLCNSVAMETLLYASGSRQIQKAMQLLGIKCTSRNIAVLVVGGRSEAVKSALAKISAAIGGKSDESVLELSEKKIERIRKVFGITETELKTLDRDTKEETVVDLVIERVALLSTLR